jgi:hypothetical protein
MSAGYTGPRLLDVLQAAGGTTPPSGKNGQVSGAEIDPSYGHQRVLVAHTEDGKLMQEAPYAATNKAPAHWSCLATPEVAATRTAFAE